MFSKACEYGIRAVIYITSKSTRNERVNITDISNEIDSPPAFTAKILQKLVKGNIIDSAKGPHGGFYIADEAIERINLLDVVYIIDGDKLYHDCALGLRECNALHPCPLHEKFAPVREDLKKLLYDSSLKELAQQLENGKTVLKILEEM